MFYSYTPLSFCGFVFLLFVFFLMRKKSKRLFKIQAFNEEYEKYKDELYKFKNAVNEFAKTKQTKSVLMSASCLEFAVQNNFFNKDFTKQFKQILQDYPNEKEFNIEINHFLS
ncbi:hypothetical protein [Campylobacter estrildidarum]|uniref:Uncharacterized protein n=1 Tax=Campylobacter estrildidarum TaxID=2510189 RepID=A0A4U7BK97_9BACT|nr:hypothetical protein [Campylobacter estrildidarum]TKX30655.1 hypothetical protein CQA69_05320 [Campylobacter estrildidarum]